MSSGTKGDVKIVSLDDLRELTTETKLVEVDGLAGAFRIRRLSVSEVIGIQEAATNDDDSVDEWRATADLLLTAIEEPEGIDEDALATWPIFVTKQLTEAISDYSGVDQDFGDDSQTG